MKTANKVILIASILFSTGAQAGDVWVTSGFLSAHTKKGHNYNGNNTGLGIEYHDSAETFFSAGTYRNSIRKQSLYAGYTYHPYSAEGVKMGATVALVTGYARYGKVAPVAMPSLSYEADRPGLNASYIPGLAFTVQAKIKF